MDEFHEKAIEMEWPADIDKLPAKKLRLLAKRMAKTASELRAQRQVEQREERIDHAVMWAAIGYDAEHSKDRNGPSIEPQGGINNRPGEKLVKSRTKGLKKRGRGMSV